jgi:6-phosphogluconolactonase
MKRFSILLIMTGLAALGANAQTVTGSGTRNKVPKFAYVANEGSSNVSAYTIDRTTGALSPIPGSPFAAGSLPFSVVVDSSGNFAYVANFASNNVSAYTIDHTTGALSPVPGSPFAAGTNPFSVAVDPSGNFAYVANGCGDPACSLGTVSAYTIDRTTGALSPVPGSPFAAGSFPSSVAVESSGNFTYVANFFSNNVSAYTIDHTTGALSPVPSSPFAAGSNPRSVTADPSGNFAYVANGGGNISAYTINPTTGSLSPVPGSPFAAGSNPPSVAVAPSGNFSYAANASSDNVSAYTIDRTTGALSPVSGSPFADASIPFSVAVDPSGKFAYVANEGSSNVSAYIIDRTTGALSPVPGSPFAAGTLPFSVAIAGQATVPFAAFTLKAEIALGPLGAFEMKGNFTLGVGSNGIDPLTEDVKLQVGTFSTTVPAGSFQQDLRGTFKFEGVISGVSLEVRIVPLGGNDFEFKAEAQGADLNGIVNPVSVKLAIGDNSGSATVIAEFDRRP